MRVLMRRTPFLFSKLIIQRSFSTTVPTENTRKVLQSATKTLRENGVTPPFEEAQLLLCYALNLKRNETLNPKYNLQKSEYEKFTQLLARRIKGEPLNYITGQKEFWTLDFEVSQSTLIPRPDTETIITSAKKLFPSPLFPEYILDLGVGSGNILLSLLDEFKNAKGIGIDISLDTLSVAKRNAKKLNFEDRTHFIESNWVSRLEIGSMLDVSSNVYKPFPLVVSNPPYIKKQDIHFLQREIANWEPRRALDGGEDGLHAYRQIALGIAEKEVVAKGGYLLLEIGKDQEKDVIKIFEDTKKGLVFVDWKKDIQDIIRCLIFKQE